ncbi:MAG: MOSC domain-containing protein [Clostridiales bacterium]|nr:MOSC domain-containing protein [Clostridiales bacterium]
MPSVAAVNISPKKGTTKVSVSKALLVADHGLQGDAHAGPGIRQVSLLGIESIEKSKERAKDQKRARGLCEGVFAENITTRGIELFSLPLGTKMQIGQALLEVSKIGKECHAGCEVARIVGYCVMPHEGIFARVLKGGEIKPGDKIEVLPSP